MDRVLAGSDCRSCDLGNMGCIGRHSSTDPRVACGVTMSDGGGGWPLRSRCTGQRAHGYARKGAEIHAPDGLDVSAVEARSKLVKLAGKMATVTFSHRRARLAGCRRPRGWPDGPYSLVALAWQSTNVARFRVVRWCARPDSCLLRGSKETALFTMRSEAVVSAAMTVPEVLQFPRNDKRRYSTARLDGGHRAALAFLGTSPSITDQRRKGVVSVHT